MTDEKTEETTDDTEGNKWLREANSPSANSPSANTPSANTPSASDADDDKGNEGN